MDLSKLSKSPNYDQAYGEYTDYLGKSKAPIDFYNEATNKLGIPDARARVARDRKSISDTQGLIDAVDPSVTGRTQGSLVTEAQRQGLVTKEKSPLLESMGRLSGIYGTSSGNLSDLMGQAQTQADYGFNGQNATTNALQFRVQQAQASDAAKRAAAAQEQQNAWITALQDQLSGLGNQLDQSQSRYEDRFKQYEADNYRFFNDPGVQPGGVLNTKLGAFAKPNTPGFMSKVNSKVNKFFNNPYAIRSKPAYTGGAAKAPLPSFMRNQL